MWAIVHFSLFVIDLLYENTHNWAGKILCVVLNSILYIALSNVLNFFLKYNQR